MLFRSFSRSPDPKLRNHSTLNGLLLLVLSPSLHKILNSVTQHSLKSSNAETLVSMPKLVFHFILPKNIRFPFDINVVHEFVLATDYMKYNMIVFFCLYRLFLYFEGVASLTVIFLVGAFPGKKNI